MHSCIQTLNQLFMKSNQVTYKILINQQVQLNHQPILFQCKALYCSPPILIDTVLYFIINIQVLYCTCGYPKVK